MTTRMFIKTVLWLTPWVVVVALCLWPGIASTDQAQYFYDELGRLVTVIDGAGNLAVYNYDEVGNLLSIDRFTAPVGGGIGIFLLSPSSGGIGIQVTIRGFGFRPTSTDNQVAFNGTPATVSSATANTLLVTVPAGATTGPVTVTNANGTATSPQPFSVALPSISGIDPSRVAQGTTTFSVVTGQHLNGATTVTFTQPGLSGTILPLPRATAQSFAMNLSVAPTVPAGSYPFSVTTANGVVGSDTVTVTVAPSVQSFSAVRPLSVYKPLPAQVAPSGTSLSAAPSVSVGMP
ncbi:MAG: IPT/TIG domain-containing protein [Nitrospiraceae bacterium]